MGGIRGACSWKILKSGASKMLFPAFWDRNLKNSEGYRMPYKIFTLSEGLIGIESGVSIKYFGKISPPTSGIYGVPASAPAS